MRDQADCVATGSAGARTNGVHWGVYRVKFGFLRAPDPLGREIMQIKWEEKIGLFWSVIWPRPEIFLSPF